MEITTRKIITTTTKNGNKLEHGKHIIQKSQPGIYKRTSASASFSVWCRNFCLVRNAFWGGLKSCWQKRKTTSWNLISDVSHFPLLPRQKNPLFRDFRRKIARLHFPKNLWFLRFSRVSRSLRTLHSILIKKSFLEISKIKTGCQIKTTETF